MTKPFQAQRAILYFAFSPAEVLSTHDLNVKLGIPSRNTSMLLRNACRDGLLAKERERSGRVLYKAGPELLKLIEGMKRWL